MHSFVGLGNMGSRIARALVVDGIHLRGYDLGAETRELFVSAGGEVGASLAETVGGTDVCFLCLPDGHVVESVLLESGGVLDAKDPPRIVVDCSSSDPVSTKRLHTRLAQAGIQFVDAPVSGGVLAADEGKLTAMVGGDEDAIEQVRPFLKSFTAHWAVAGGSGSGHATKAVNNYLSALSFLATSEALLSGSALGMKPKRVIDLVNASRASSQNSEVKFPRFVIPGTYNAGFSIGLLAKDVDIAYGIGATLGTFAPVVAVCRALLRTYANVLGFGADWTRAHEAAQSWAHCPREPYPEMDQSVQPEDLIKILETVLRAGTVEAAAFVSGLGLDIGTIFSLISHASGRNEFVLDLAESNAPQASTLEGPESGRAAKATLRRLLDLTGVPLPLTGVAVDAAIANRNDIQCGPFGDPPNG